MSKYTTELRFICEQSSGLTMSGGLSGINNIIEKARPELFNFSYPIFDVGYRSVLETKIIRHFYTREIGFETVGLFRFYLENKMNEIMPYYNQLYKSELLEFNPLYDVDITRKHNVVKDGNTKTIATSNTSSTGNVKNTSSGSSDSLSTTLVSDTPQGGLNGVVSSDYLTNATKENGTVNNNLQSSSENSSIGSESSNNTTNITDIEDYLETVSGKQGTQSYASMIREYRENFLNIDMMVVKDLETLFMSLW